MSPTVRSGDRKVYDYAQKYEQMIEDAGGLDLQILGIGRTGHIGFNEPEFSQGIVDSSGQPRRLDPLWMLPATSSVWKMYPCMPSPWGLGRLCMPAKSCSWPEGQGKRRLWPRQSNNRRSNPSPQVSSRRTKTSVSSWMRLRLRNSPD